MDFDFSDDQEQLRDAVRKWVDRSYGFDRRRAAVRAGGFDRAAYRELADLGLTGLYVPQDLGGLGMGPIEGMVAMEELGRGLVIEPLAHALIAGSVLHAFAPEAVQRAWLPRVAGGEALVVLAHLERAGRWRIDQCQARAEPAGAGWKVTGTKSVVPAGDQADAFLVPATSASGLGLWLVERAAEGVRTRGYLTQDGSRAAEVFLEGAPATLVTQVGLTALAQAVDTGIAAVCAEGVGVMDQTLALTAGYLNTRKQFGVPIASFQALRHRVADMKMQLELARSMSYYASLKLDAPPEERRLALARAKYQLGVSMRFVGQSSVQLHGGIGVTDDYIGSHYFKKLTQLELTFGDTLHHLGEVSSGLRETAGVFA